MKYSLSINDTTVDILDHNVQAHVDIEKDIQDRKNGQFTFTLRIHGGKIADYNVTEYVDIKKKYFRPVGPVTFGEYTVSHVVRK